MVDRYGTGEDPYCIPGTQILRNKLGIRDEGILQRAEQEITAKAVESIQFAQPPYDLSYLQQLHTSIFGELYDWAGEIRQIDISKGDTRFCSNSLIEAQARRYFGELERQNNFEDMAQDALIDAIATLYGDINVIHPFREGNGRAQRMLFEHILLNCGYAMDWNVATKLQWVDANIQSYYGHSNPLAAIFRHGINAI